MLNVSLCLGVYSRFHYISPAHFPTNLLLLRREFYPSLGAQNKTIWSTPVVPPYNIRTDMEKMSRVGKFLQGKVADCTQTFWFLVISCVRLQKKEPQTAFPMSFTWVSHIVASMLTGC